MARDSILVVEDEQTIPREIIVALTNTGREVLTASDAPTALKLAASHHPALVLLDVVLPSMNGYEVCRLLRADGLRSPVIMLTAEGLDSDKMIGLDLGANDYVTKPFEIKDLLARVDRYLKLTVPEAERDEMAARVILAAPMLLAAPRAAASLVAPLEPPKLQPERVEWPGHIAQQYREFSGGEPVSHNELLKHLARHLPTDSEGRGLSHHSDARFILSYLRRLQARRIKLAPWRPKAAQAT